MNRSKWLHVGDVLGVNAVNYPGKLGWQDRKKEFTFAEWNDRARRFANGLKDLGVGFQERFGVIAYNRGEWMDFYAGCAKGGQVIVPVMFRLAGPEIEYIVNHSECKCMIVESPFVELIDSIKKRLPCKTYVYLGDGPAPEGYIGYEDLLKNASPLEPPAGTSGEDVWHIMYTSGTTGKPKGVVRTHEATMAHYMLCNMNMGVRPADKVMLVMPMCHVNSIFYSFPYTLLSAPVFVYDRPSFDAADLLSCIDKYRITFTSLVPTHYSMILGLPEEVKRKAEVSSVRQLLISSAPASKQLKLDIMDYFSNAELWEAYGCTEGGLATMLRPEDQFKKLGSIGREAFGVDRIKLLDANRREVEEGRVGELYYRSPCIFKEYLKDPQKTEEAFEGEWFSAGDMAVRDAEGYYTLVDRKANMIITGGENVYPSEVENALRAHPAVKEAAVVGVPDSKWGEAIKAVVVLNDGFEAGDALGREIVDSCRGSIAGYKLPKTVEFIKEQDMPRTATGKILHRVIKGRYSA